MNVIEKLTAKGFNGADVHLFLQRFGVELQVYQPRQGILIPIFSEDTQEDIDKRVNKEKELDRLHQEEFINRNKARWEEASIAADFENCK